MKLTHGLVAAILAGLIFATGNTAFGQDDPWGSGSGDSGSSSGSGSGGAADSGSGSGGSADSGSGSGSGGTTSGDPGSGSGSGSGDAMGSGNADDSPFSSGGSSKRATKEVGVTAVPVGMVGLGLRSFDFAGTIGIGAGPEIRYWLDPGFGLQGAFGFGIRSVDGANTEVTFAISAGTMLNLLGEDASPVYLQFGQRISFGFVSNPGGGTGDSSGLLFAGSAGFASTGEGFALGIGRSGTLLGNAGFTFYF